MSMLINGIYFGGIFLCLMLIIPFWKGRARLLTLEFWAMPVGFIALNFLVICAVLLWSQYLPQKEQQAGFMVSLGPGILGFIGLPIVVLLSVFLTEPTGLFARAAFGSGFFALECLVAVVWVMLGRLIDK